MVRKTRKKVYMSDSTLVPDERNKEIADAESLESSSEDPFDRFEKTMKEGFQAMTNSMNHMSQSITQSVEKGHLNTTLQGNETRACLTQFFEQVMQAAQEDKAFRKKDEMLENTKASTGIPKYSLGQTSGYANPSFPKLATGSSFRMPFQTVQTLGFDTTPIPPVAMMVANPTREP
ncbi:hypothetical protein Pyn_20883 [Prunus yedoensis var. nudiflora]|uniref:Uncharacterized protein n=1 Tax=Prunus yedoensis var. nudiflora TaxID=2094558 RepID=A0A314ZGF3_PRUYE|nr:hypothetical protein Pyn_20883 [Prunus yedoensis var. nudiflora]